MHDYAHCSFQEIALAGDETTKDLCTMEKLFLQNINYVLPVNDETEQQYEKIIAKWDALKPDYTGKIKKFLSQLFLANQPLIQMTRNHVEIIPRL